MSKEIFPYIYTLWLCRQKFSRSIDFDVDTVLLQVPDCNHRANRLMRGFYRRLAALDAARRLIALREDIHECDSQAPQCRAIKRMLWWVDTTSQTANDVTHDVMQQQQQQQAASASTDARTSIANEKRALAMIMKTCVCVSGGGGDCCMVDIAPYRGRLLIKGDFTTACQHDS